MVLEMTSSCHSSRFQRDCCFFFQPRSSNSKCIRNAVPLAHILIAEFSLSGSSPLIADFLFVASSPSAIFPITNAFVAGKYNSDKRH